MLVVLLSFVLGLDDGHIPTFWLLLYSLTSHRRELTCWHHTCNRLWVFNVIRTPAGRRRRSEIVCAAEGDPKATEGKAPEQQQ